MKILNCACPQCGKQTSEYDNDKWTCLYCGNKFVIKEEADTHIHNNVDIRSDALFDIDLSSGAGIPTYKPVSSLISQEAFQEIFNRYKHPEPILRNNLLTFFGLLFWIWVGVLMLCVKLGQIKNNQDDVFGCFLSLTTLVTIPYCWWWWKRRKSYQTNKANNDMVQAYVDSVYNLSLATEMKWNCPWCGQTCETVINNNVNDALHQIWIEDIQKGNFIDMNIHLEKNKVFEHCIHCGKQYYIINNKLCKIKT